MNTYLSIYDYLGAPTGQNTAALVGNVFRFTAVQQAGATLLIVPTTALTVQLQPYDTLSIFDGPNSELIQVSTMTLPNSTAIRLLSGLQYQHNPGVAVCSDGTGGSLATQLFTASQWIEDTCHQALWATTYTNEILTMPTMRAALDNEHNLHFRPRHFPITAISALSIQTTQLDPIAYDPTQAIIDADQQTVDIPNLAPIPSSMQSQQTVPYVMTPQLSRRQNAWITLTYTAGYSTLPWPVRRAGILLTSACMAELSNPVGADSIQTGKRNVTFMLRGDQSGDSLLVKQAMKLLQPYIAEAL